ncbi:MAG: citryl-CoA lyase [Deltaproteobacteria bacterium]|nr:citryl-CoA lyase [Deltaproteobacteria bacterium]
MSEAPDAAALLEEAARYWRTSITEIRPGHIGLRGYPIEELIGRAGFAEVLWLLLRGELPDPRRARLLEAALVASVDHGPQAPAIAIARSAVSCGLPLNGAMASAINALGDVHGGAGQQALELFLRIEALRATGQGLDEAVTGAIGVAAREGEEHLPGYGHRFHPVDPRSGRLLALVEEARAAGLVSGRLAEVARACEAALERRKGRHIPLNIDGATAVVYGELGFAPPLARGLFCLARGVGILAHAWEQSGTGERNKGPMPRAIPYRYEGPGERHLPEP